MSGLLYHRVGKWTPKGGITPEGITPGRISHVFFSPQNSIAQLEGKADGWKKGLWVGRLWIQML